MENDNLFIDLDKQFEQMILAAVEDSFITSKQVSVIADTISLNDPTHNVKIPSIALPVAYYRKQDGKTEQSTITGKDFYPSTAGFECTKLLIVNNDRTVISTISADPTKKSSLIKECLLKSYLSSYSLPNKSTMYAILKANEKTYNSWDAVVKPMYKSKYMKPLFAWYVCKNGLVSNELSVTEDQPAQATEQEMKIYLDEMCNPVRIRAIESIIYSCAVNWYVTNHYIGTENFSPFILKVLKILDIFTEDATADQIKDCKSDVHQMFHAFSVRNALYGMFKGELTAKIPIGFPVPPFFQVDNFLQIRKSASPAGTHKLSNAATALSIISNMRLAMFYPRFVKAKLVVSAYKEVMLDRMSYHIGSMYLKFHPLVEFQRPEIAVSEDILLEILADINLLLTSAISNHSLLKSPIVSKAPMDKVHPQWKAVVGAYTTLVNSIPKEIGKNISKLTAFVTIDISGIKNAEVIADAQHLNEVMCDNFNNAMLAVRNGHSVSDYEIDQESIQNLLMKIEAVKIEEAEIERKKKEEDEKKKLESSNMFAGQGGSYALKEKDAQEES